jgi:starvation-inducible outer membrane lipoprotein
MQHTIRAFIFAAALICEGCASVPSPQAATATPVSSLQQSTIDRLDKLDDFINRVR